MQKSRCDFNTWLHVKFICYICKGFYLLVVWIPSPRLWVTVWLWTVDPWLVLVKYDTSMACIYINKELVTKWDFFFYRVCSQKIAVSTPCKITHSAVFSVCYCRTKFLWLFFSWLFSVLRYIYSILIYMKAPRYHRNLEVGSLWQVYLFSCYWILVNI